MKIFVFCLLFAGTFAGVRRIPSYHRERTGIVGGNVAAPGQFPFQLSLQQRMVFSTHYICGASVYTEKVAITAAHCAADNSENLWVVAGKQSLSTSDPVNEQEREITKVIQHKKFNGTSVENDISLLFWAKPLTFNARVQPVILPSPFAEESGDFIVSGWGKISGLDHQSDVLLYVSVPFVDDATCQADYTSKYLIAKSMICAGEEGKGSCNGDSGGPLSQDGELVGIVSWSLGCARAGYPGVYTQVSYFIDWIKENVAKVNKMP